MLMPKITAPCICWRARSVFTILPASATIHASSTWIFPPGSCTTDTTAAVYVRKLRCAARPSARPALRAAFPQRPVAGFVAARLRDLVDEAVGREREVDVVHRAQPADAHQRLRRTVL